MENIKQKAIREVYNKEKEGNFGNIFGIIVS